MDLQYSSFHSTIRDNDLLSTVGNNYAHESNRDSLNYDHLDQEDYWVHKFKQAFNSLLLK